MVHKALVETPDVPPPIFAYTENDIEMAYSALESAFMKTMMVVLAVVVFGVLGMCGKRWCTNLNPMPVMEPSSYRSDDTTERAQVEIV